MLAGEGRIPLWQPTTIAQSGEYVVTRDIGLTPSPTSPRAITVTADDVDIDLNGFTLRLGEPVIYAENVSNLHIHNGQIVAFEDAIALINVDRFVIRRVQIDSWEDLAVIVSGTNGLLEDNQVDYFNGGIFASGNGIDIRRNELHGWDVGISLQECIGCKARENTLTGGAHILVDAATTGNLIMNNVLSGIGGFGDGIKIEGSRNHVEGNLVTDFQGFGLFFTQPSAFNVYRRNTVRGNGGTGCTSPPDFCNHGAGNTSHGDNYMPGAI